jgi:hypothetical protein
MAWVDRRGRWSSKRVDYDILTQALNMIDEILIPIRYNFFS